MRLSVGRVATAVGVSSMVLGFGVGEPAASAAPGVTFGAAHFSAYASGTELHLGAVTSGSTTLAGVDQAFSGASAATGGLTAPISSETGNVVQPPQPAPVRSYARGSGLEIGVGTSRVGTSDPNQVTLAGLAQAAAPPDDPTVSKSVPVSLAPVATAGLVTGTATADWLPTACPRGPFSLGTGNLASAQLLDIPTTTAPTVATGGGGAASTTSYTTLSPNGDGTYGISSVGQETVAPLSVNLLNLLTVHVTVAGATPDAPIGLVATTTGRSSGASVKLVNGGLVTVTLQPTGGPAVTVAQVELDNPSTLGPSGFLHIDLSTSDLGSALTSVSDALAAVINGTTPPTLSPVGNLFGPGGPLQSLVGQSGMTASAIAAKLADVSLGTLDIDAVPHAIGAAPSTPPTVVGGTQAAGAIDLVHLHLALDIQSVLGVAVPSNPLGSTDIADLRLGHLEASATDAAPIDCNPPATTGSATAVLPPTVAPAPPPVAPAAPVVKTLPFTGAMGGPWQPFAGLGLLALGGGAFALVRRARRMGNR